MRCQNVKLFLSEPLAERRKSIKIMSQHKNQNRISNELFKILEGMTFGWENQFEQSIGPETLLGADLGLKSIDIARFIAAIQKHYNHYELPFQELFIHNGRPIKDLSILDVADFLSKHIDHI